MRSVSLTPIVRGMDAISCLLLCCAQSTMTARGVEGRGVELRLAVGPQRHQIMIGIVEEELAGDAEADALSAELQLRDTGGTGEARHRRKRVAEDVLQIRRGAGHLLGE